MTLTNKEEKRASLETRSQAMWHWSPPVLDKPHWYSLRLKKRIRILKKLGIPHEISE